MKQSDVPANLQHLPFNRGYPVPYFVHWKDDKPLFHFANPQKWKACLKYKKCWVCGRELKGALFMLTGPKGLANRVGTDTFMHEDCARQSLQLCPHMLHEKADRREDHELGGQPVNAHHDLTKPSEIILVKVGKWQVIFTGKTNLINYQPVAIQQFHYVNGLLTARDPALFSVTTTGWKVNGFGIVNLSKL
jgi:hypothetical protein